MASDAIETAGDGTDDGDGLIFQWQRRRSRPRWRLALMLVISLLVHAASFYVLQVAYTPTGTQLPPPAQVVLVPLDQPENAALARWLAMDDPALMIHASAPAAPQVLASLGFRYVPSYDAAPPPFKPLEPAASTFTTAPPRPRLPGPVPAAPLPVAPAASRPSPPARAQARQTTRLVLTGAIETLAGSPPPLRFNSGQTIKVLEPTVFLVGVRPEGGEPFLFRQSTSGDAAADEFARGYLTAFPFKQPPAAEQKAAWGQAAFYWGNDVYR